MAHLCTEKGNLSLYSVAVVWRICACKQGWSCMWITYFALACFVSYVRGVHSSVSFHRLKRYLGLWFQSSFCLAWLIVFRVGPPTLSVLYTVGFWCQTASRGNVNNTFRYSLVCVHGLRVPHSPFYQTILTFYHQCPPQFLPKRTYCLCSGPGNASRLAERSKSLGHDLLGFRLRGLQYWSLSRYEDYCG